MIRIRLLSAPKPKWSDPRIEFDPSFSARDSDGLLVWGAMQPEFLTYKGPRAWFIDEPRTQGMFGSSLYKQALRDIRPHEFLHHSNRDPRYRLPCATHYGELTIANPAERKDAAIAVVSNFGGRVWWIRDHVVSLATNFGPGIRLRRGVRLRNKFILHPMVDLFGDPKAWALFRRWPWSSPGPPPNYRGPNGSWWLFGDHIEALARYRVVVCLENASLPYYFTEKLVNAARAGCVPVYHAHPTVRRTYLKGARWIDPEDYGFDPSATLEAALRCDAEAVRRQNWAWVQSEEVKSTEGFRVWSRIADYFVDRMNGKV
jgi:hypothetical protein